MIFLDCGAYDGDSVQGFLDYVGHDYGKIIAVEASKKNYNALVKNLSDVPRVECHNTGIFSERTRLCFSIDDAKNSFQNDNGTEIINVDSIDNILGGQRVDFIKMDIEGAEYDALIGARKTLIACTPVLAISIYHKVEDLYRLQLLIEEICPGRYDYYIRHYSPTVIETILYAVPKNCQL